MLPPIFFSSSGFVSADDPAAAASRDQVVCRSRSPRPDGIDLGVTLGLPGLDERIDYFPLQLDLLRAWKCRVTAGKDL